MSFEVKKAKVISFINMKGGVGKTTLTINIGAKLAEKNKVLIIDMDPQFNATQSLLLYQAVQKGEVSSLSGEELAQNEMQSSEYYEQLSQEKKNCFTNI